MPSRMVCSRSFCLHHNAFTMGSSKLRLPRDSRSQYSKTFAKMRLSADSEYDVVSQGPCFDARQCRWVVGLFSDQASTTEELTIFLPIGSPVDWSYEGELKVGEWKIGNKVLY